MFNMAGNKFNNAGNSASVNTRLYSSFSNSCFLTLGAWNEQFSLKFAPFKGVDANGVNQYATDRTEIITTSLTVDNAITLVTGVKEKIYPALDKKESAEVSVSMGANENKKVLKVATDGNEVTITLYLGVAENGVANGDKISHTFNTREYMTSYDPTSGVNESNMINADFINFMSKIENVQSLSQMTPHAIKYGNAISSSFANKNGNNSNFGNNGGNGYNSQPTVQTNTYGSMDEFLPFN